MQLTDVQLTDVHPTGVHPTRAHGSDRHPHPGTRRRTWRTRRARHTRPVKEHGSALALVPAGFLVLIILGALAVDSATAFLGQRQLGDALTAAANDAAGAGLSNPAFYGSGALVIDPGTAVRVVCHSLAAQTDQDLSDVHVEIAVAGNAVGVRATAEATAVFGRAIPGFGHHQVSAVAVAYAGGSPAGRVPPNPAAYQSLSCSSL